MKQQIKAGGKEATLEYVQSEKNKQWYWTLTAKNGKQIASCLPEMYINRKDCVYNASEILLKKWSEV